MAAPLPTADDLGPRPTPQSRRQLAVVGNAGAVGDALVQAGVTMKDIGEHIEQRWDEDDVRRLDVEHAQRAREIRTTAREARGLNAQAARQEADAQLAALDQDILGRARSNTSRRALETMVSRRTSLERDTIADHARTEVGQAMEASILARVDTSTEEAEELWDRPEEMERSLATALREVDNLGQWRGADPATIANQRAQVLSRVRANVVSQMVQQEDYDGANAYLEAHRGEIEAEQEGNLTRLVNAGLRDLGDDRNAAWAISSAGAEGAPAPVVGPVPGGNAVDAAPRPITPGNIDVSTRPPVRNRDGTVSTVRTISIGTDEGEVLIPTVVNGRVVSDQQAIAHYRQTGEHLGIFRTAADADAYAVALHEDEARRVSPPASPQRGGPAPAFVDSFSQYHGGAGSAPGAPRPYRHGVHAPNARDYPTPANTPLRAELDWELAPSPRPRDHGQTHGEDSAGKWFSVRYSDGSVHIFRHVSTIPTRTSGRAGEEMARSGNSGIHNSGPHTHRESWVMENGRLTGVDPQAYIERNRGTSPERVAAGSPAPDGTNIDLDRAYARIETLDISPSAKLRARNRVRELAAQNDVVRNRARQDADEEVTRALAAITAGGGRLTNVSQLPAGVLSRASPNTVLQIQQMIEANNRPHEPEANSPLVASLYDRAANDPNGFMREVNPELYRGRITDGEVMGLHALRNTIGNRTGPQPSTVMGMINMVLPETELVPTHVTNDQRQGSGSARETEEQARARLTNNVRSQIFSGVQQRLARNFPQGTQPSEQDVLDAVRAETAVITIDGQQTRFFQYRQSHPGQEPGRFQIVIPTRSLPYIDAVLRASGRQITGAERIAEYMRHKSAYDAR